MADIQADLTFHADWAKSVLMEKNAFTPMFVVDCNEGLVPILADFGSDEEKDSCLRFVRLFCLAYDATSVTLIAESWVTVIEVDGTRTRSEALVVTIAGRSAEPIASFHTIERDAGGKIVTIRDDPQRDD